MKFQLIVNKANPVQAMSTAEVSKLFLRKTATWNSGSQVLPVDQVGSSSTREYFSRHVHGKPVSAVKAYWHSQIFSGRGVPPPEQPSDSGVIAYVRSHPGAVGYVSTEADVSSVKIVTLAGGSD